jgi:hypothetical protein
MSTSPVSVSLTGSPLSSRAVSSASFIDATARDLLRPSSMTSIAPLTGEELYDFHGNYHKARQLLEESSLEEGRALFLKILEELVIEGDNDPDLIFRGECKIGVAYTHSDCDKIEMALEAKKDLDLAFAHHKSWQPDDQEFMLRNFRFLEALYGQFQYLLPDAEPELKKDIQEKISECRKILGTLSPSSSPEIPRLKPKRLKLPRTVKPGPVDESWKRVKLVFAFTCAGVVIASIAFFIRRWIIRIDLA